jgi:hypothetical protein
LSSGLSSAAGNQTVPEQFRRQSIVRDKECTMHTDKEFLLTFPCFVLECADGTTLGFERPGILGLAVFTDEHRATEYASRPLGLPLGLRPFADKDVFMDYLRSPRGQFDHVTIDPAPHKLAGFISVPQLFELLDAANCV